ncbi:MAG: DUF2600 family protein [Clostridiaceae bacterium]|nr:DUF2600 family protein [Clostridiaceae bacterium]
MVARYSKGPQLIFRHAHKVFPKVETMLLRKQSLYSTLYGNNEESFLKTGFFDNRHLILDGSLFALYPGVSPVSFLKFIVSFQVLAQYIDLLLSREERLKEPSIMETLFVSYRDAVDSKRKMSCYMGAYEVDHLSALNKLVEECRSQILRVPSYNLVIGQIKKHVQLLSELQMLAHTDRNNIDKSLEAWSLKYYKNYPDITMWEFCAAARSSLPVFVLFAAAYDRNLTSNDVEDICSAYFPWICILQTMLKDFVNPSVLSANGLNFVHYYKNLKSCEERLAFFIEQALERCSALKYPEFHQTVVKSIISVSLSDPRASQGMNKIASMSLLRKGGEGISMYHKFYRFARFTGVL